MCEFSVRHWLSAKSELSSPIEKGESLSSLEPFPILSCDLRSSSVIHDDNRSDEGSLGEMKKVAKDQKELDMCAEGYGVASLRRLMVRQAIYIKYHTTVSR
ncbi:hypothetical protein LINGRAHAP2_LOCUS31451 [Linum grandiflorum]